MDPTKLKARQFSRNTEEKVTDNTLWTETPAQRLARLTDEASGKRKRTENSAATEEGDEEKKRRKRDKEIRKVVEEHNVRVPPCVRSCAMIYSQVSLIEINTFNDSP